MITSSMLPQPLQCLTPAEQLFALSVSFEVSLVLTGQNGIISLYVLL
jgi:hypothetical protein